MKINVKLTEECDLELTLEVTEEEKHELSDKYKKDYNAAVDMIISNIDDSNFDRLFYLNEYDIAILGHLTSAPMFTDFLVDEDEEIPEDVNKWTWIYQNYQITDWIEDLLQKGTTKFTQAIKLV